MASPFRPLAPATPRIVEFRYEAFAPSGNSADCSPLEPQSSVTFGCGTVNDLSAPQGVQTEIDIIVSNNGTIPLNVISWDLSGTGFALGASPPLGWINPGSYVKLPLLVLASTPSGSYTAYLSIETSDRSIPCVITLNLTVTPQACVPVSITVQPSNHNSARQGSYSFITAAAGTAPFTYKWQILWTLLGGGWDTTWYDCVLGVNGVPPGDHGPAINITSGIAGPSLVLNYTDPYYGADVKFRCVVTNACGTTMTNQAQIYAAGN